jgi:hypothetical protein
MKSHLECKHATYCIYFDFKAAAEKSKKGGCVCEYCQLDLDERDIPESEIEEDGLCCDCRGIYQSYQER